MIERRSRFFRKMMGSHIGEVVYGTGAYTVRHNMRYLHIIYLLRRIQDPMKHLMLNFLRGQLTGLNRLQKPEFQMFDRILNIPLIRLSRKCTINMYSTKNKNYYRNVSNFQIARKYFLIANFKQGALHNKDFQLGVLLWRFYCELRIITYRACLLVPGLFGCSVLLTKVFFILPIIDKELITFNQDIIKKQ